MTDGVVIGKGVVEVAADTKTLDKGMEGVEKTVTRAARDARGRFIKAGTGGPELASALRRTEGQFGSAFHRAARVSISALAAIPRAFVASMRQAVRSAAAMLSTLNSRARGVLGSPRAALGSGGGLLVGAAALAGPVLALRKAVMAASDLNETISKTGVVFGDATKIVTDGADEMAARFGTPKQEFLDAASSIGLIAKAANLAQPDAARLSVQFAKLGADAASFYNVPLEEALTSLRAGLVGESEPMRRFGVLLNEDAVKAEALRLKLGEAGKELTEGAKVQARASLILTGMKDATGDLERTSDQLANRLRELWGRVENLAASIGQFLLPAAKTLTSVFSEMARGVAESLERNKGVLASWGESLRQAAAYVGVIYRNFERFKTIGKLFLGDLGSHIMAILEALGKNIANWADHIGKVIRDAIVEGITSALAGTALGQMFGIKNAVLAQPRKPPALVRPNFQRNPAIDAEFAAINQAEAGRNALNVGKNAFGRAMGFMGRFLAEQNKRPVVARPAVGVAGFGLEEGLANADAREKRAKADRLRDKFVAGKAAVPKQLVQRAERQAKAAENKAFDLFLWNEFGIAPQKQGGKGANGGKGVVGERMADFRSEFTGLEDFAKRITTGALSSKQDDWAKKTAEATEETASLLSNINGKIKNGPIVAVAQGPE